MTGTAKAHRAELQAVKRRIQRENTARLKQVNRLRRETARA